jgi:hypothetical protein
MMGTVLRKLLKQPMSQPFDISALKQIIDIGTQDDQSILEYFRRMQEIGLIKGATTPHEVVQENLEKSLPELLSRLVDGKALLADSQGFYLGRHGFRHETAEELAGLSADLAALYVRHEGLLKGNMGMYSSAWGLINAGGLSELGFWPLFIGVERFVLVISGMPSLNHPAFLDLIWALYLRYGE